MQDHIRVAFSPGHWFLYTTVPIGVALGFWGVPAENLDLSPRVLTHVLGFGLSYLPFYLGRYWRSRRPAWATGAYLSANALRILGIFGVLLVFQTYDPSRTLPALEVYVITVGCFLVFQLVALRLFWKHGKG